MITPLSPGLPRGSAQERTALTGILILGAVLRVLALDKPLYIDEIVSLTVATQPLDQMARAMRLIDASPALSPLLLHLWLAVRDTDVWARLLMAIFGWLTIPAAFVAGSLAFDRRSARWAAFATAIAPALVHYSQYVRNYSLFTLLAVVHLAFAIRLLGDSTTAKEVAPGTWSGYRGLLKPYLAVAALATAMLYTHYLALVYFLPSGLLAASQVRRRSERTWGWLAAHALAGILFAPGIPLLAHNLQADAMRNDQRPLPAAAHILVPNVALEMVVGQRALGFSDPAVRRYTLVAAAGTFPALLVAGVVCGWRVRPRTVLLLVTVAVLPLVLYVATGRRLVAVRFFLPSIAAALVIAGHGVRTLRLPVRVVAATALSVLSAVPLWHFYVRYEWSYDHRRVADAIRARHRPGDIMLVVHPFESFYYRRYLRDTLPVVGVTFTPLVEQTSYVIKPAPIDALAVRQRIEAALAASRRAWVVGQSRRSFASSAVQERALFAWMDRRYREADTLDDLTGGDPTIRLYEAGAAASR